MGVHGEEHNAAPGRRRELRSKRSGRPPQGASCSTFRFLPTEVAELERLWDANDGPPNERSIYETLAAKFRKARQAAGQSTVRARQIWNWFQNKRYKLTRAAKTSLPPVLSIPKQTDAVLANQTKDDSLDPEFEAVSSRDGAWYDVATFLAHRVTESGHAEVRVRFTGFGGDEDEWIDLKKYVRKRSLPCEGFECVAVLPGDVILCFQEGSDQALYFDASVLDVQRRRHDARGCRCRFWVRYEHDQTEEVVPLRKICRRPETNHRLKQYYASRSSSSADAVQGSEAATFPSSQLQLSQPQNADTCLAEATVEPSQSESQADEDQDEYLRCLESLQCNISASAIVV